jgi:hypothetical protein
LDTFKVELHQTNCKDLEQALLKCSMILLRSLKWEVKMLWMLDGEIDEILYTRAGGIMAAEEMVGKLATWL